jgi:nickel and cobalt resistance protein CnrR
VKRTLVLLMMVALISTGLSFAMSRWMVSRGQPSMVTSIHDVAWLSHELNLSEAQKRDVEKLAKDFQTKLNASCATHCAARMALGDELMKPQPDALKARAAIEQMNQVQADAERVTLDHILKVRSLLTDEQALQYSALIRNQVCSMPMGTP